MDKDRTMKHLLAALLLSCSGCSAAQLSTGLRLVGVACELLSDVAGQDLEYLCRALDAAPGARAAVVRPGVRVRVPRSERAAFEARYGR